MKKLKKALRFPLILVSVIILLLALVIAVRSKSPHLHVSRSEAIATVVKETEFTRNDMKRLRTELEYDGMGDYPCYYIFFSYLDEDGQEVQVRCAVDGETGEYLGMTRIE